MSRQFTFLFAETTEMSKQFTFLLAETTETSKQTGKTSKQFAFLLAEITEMSKQNRKLRIAAEWRAISASMLHLTLPRKGMETHQPRLALCA
jgi:hypothetical protein